MAGDGAGGDRTYTPDARTGECPEGMHAVYPAEGPAAGICVPDEAETPTEEDFESDEVDEEEREDCVLSLPLRMRCLPALEIRLHRNRIGPLAMRHF